jgi:hypothetical protein
MHVNLEKHTRRIFRRTERELPIDLSVLTIFGCSGVPADHARITIFNVPDGMNCTALNGRANGIAVGRSGVVHLCSDDN